MTRQFNVANFKTGDIIKFYPGNEGAEPEILILYSIAYTQEEIDEAGDYSFVRSNGDKFIMVQWSDQIKYDYLGNAYTLIAAA